MNAIQSVRDGLQQCSNPGKAKVLQGFFKTGKGEYGEGDVFLGVVVPETRRIAKKYFKEINLDEVGGLLESKIHEERLCALLILVLKFQQAKSGSEERKEIFGFYVSHARKANNWDLVDLSAPTIAGGFLAEAGNQEKKKILFRLAKSHNLWERRIAIVSTFAFIRKNSFPETFKIAEMLLDDKHDLIHKAAGWMLREAGKRDIEAEEKFLQKHSAKMPRTMLRYAIEKFPEKKRKRYLKMAK